MKKRSGWVWRVCFLVVTGSLAACTPAAIPPTQPIVTLPAPQVQVTHQADSGETPGFGGTQVTPTKLVDNGRLADSVAELARSVHGARLVEWIEIPSLNIVAPVTPVGWQPVANALDESAAVTWDSPDASVGWVVTSALPGENGNILMYGHNNLHASVFLKLSELKPGELITVRTGEKSWAYRARDIIIFPVVTGEQDNAAYQKYFQPTGNETLTLLSCWPPISNTHRVVVIAEPKTD